MQNEAHAAVPPSAIVKYYANAPNEQETLILHCTPTTTPPIQGCPKYGCIRNMFSDSREPRVERTKYTIVHVYKIINTMQLSKPSQFYLISGEHVSTFGATQGTFTVKPVTYKVAKRHTSTLSSAAKKHFPRQDQCSAKKVYVVYTMTFQLEDDDSFEDYKEKVYHGIVPLTPTFKDNQL